MIYIFVNSYNREQMCYDLVDRLSYQLKDIEFSINVHLDGCIYHKRHKKAIYHFEKRHGRENYYQLVEKQIKELPSAEFYYKLDDDVVIHDDFIKKSLLTWQDIRDSNKIALNLLKDYRCSMWGFTKRKSYNKDVDLSHWTDLNFMAGRRFYQATRNVNFIKRNIKTSSGVGKQLSKLLNRHGNIYQVKKTLVYHGDHNSEMNPTRIEKLSNI